MKGWKTPPNTVYVGRGSKWGNPHRVTEEVPASEAVAKFRASCGELSSLARSELKGKIFPVGALSRTTATLMYSSSGLLVDKETLWC